MHQARGRQREPEGPLAAPGAVCGRQRQSWDEGPEGASRPLLSAPGAWQVNPVCSKSGPAGSSCCTHPRWVHRGYPLPPLTTALEAQAHWTEEGDEV